MKSFKKLVFIGKIKDLKAFLEDVDAWEEFHHEQNRQ
jgi:hypothetical protein